MSIEITRLTTAGCSPIPKGVVCTFGSEFLVDSFEGKKRRFEYHRVCGPHPITVHGELYKNIPPWFWRMWSTISVNFYAKFPEFKHSKEATG